MTNNSEPADKRDRHGLNQHVKVQLDEVLGEPEVPGKIPERVWNASNVSFNICQKLCYKVLSVVCAVPAAACHGCTYAQLAFCHTWCLTPRLRAWRENMRIVGQYWGACVYCICDPCAEVCRKCRNGGEEVEIIY